MSKKPVYAYCWAKYLNIPIYKLPRDLKLCGNNDAEAEAKKFEKSYVFWHQHLVFSVPMNIHIRIAPPLPHPWIPLNVMPGFQNERVMCRNKSCGY